MIDRGLILVTISSDTSGNFQVLFFNGALLITHGHYLRVAQKQREYSNVCPPRQLPIGTRRRYRDSNTTMSKSTLSTFTCLFVAWLLFT